MTWSHRTLSTSSRPTLGTLMEIRLRPILLACLLAYLLACRYPVTAFLLRSRRFRPLLRQVCLQRQATIAHGRARRPITERQVAGEGWTRATRVGTGVRATHDCHGAGEAFQAARTLHSCGNAATLYVRKAQEVKLSATVVPLAAVAGSLSWPCGHGPAACLLGPSGPM